MRLPAHFSTARTPRLLCGRRSSASLQALALSLALGNAGCSSELTYGSLRDAGRAVPIDATTDRDGAVDAASPPDARTPFCALRGPMVEVSDFAPAACASASRGYHYALAVCNAFVSGGVTQVDGFDSRLGPYVSGQASGALAAGNGLYLTTGNVGGSVWITGSAGSPLKGDLTIGGNLFDLGPLLGPEHAVRVAGDAHVAGDVRLAELSVGGRFTLGKSAALEIAAAAPPVTRADVTVQRPVSCDSVADIEALVEAASRDNDNTSIRLEAASSLKLFDAQREVTLPCGRYFVEDLYAAGALTVRITGRVALYVRNGVVVENTGALTIRLDDDAELDLFVVQGLSNLGSVQIGSPSAPTRARLHFATNGSLSFTGPALLAASLYAPRGQLVTESRFELFGAALLGRVASGPLTLHYDRALAADSCAAARCTTNADCASPLRCDALHCLP